MVAAGVAQTVAVGGPFGAQVPAAKGKGAIGPAPSTIKLDRVWLRARPRDGAVGCVWLRIGVRLGLSGDPRALLRRHQARPVFRPRNPTVTVHLTELDNRNAIASALAGRQLVVTWPGGAALSASAVEVTRSGGAQVISSAPGCAGPWRAVHTTAPVTVASAVPPAPAPPGGRRLHHAACGQPCELRAGGLLTGHRPAGLPRRPGHRARRPDGQRPAPGGLR